MGTVRKTITLTEQQDSRGIASSISFLLLS